MANKQKRQNQIFRKVVQGERPSAAMQNQITATIKQLLRQYAPYDRLYSIEVINVTAYDATRELYTGTVQYNSNPVHITNATSGAVTFEDTSPAYERKEIADPLGILQKDSQVGKLILAKFHPQSGYFIALENKTSTCDFIRFEIIEVGTNALSIRFAKVEILSRPCGCEEVPEEVELIVSPPSTLGPGIERVYDMAGCYLNEPDEDLVGRIGYAKYLQDIRFISSPIEPGNDVPDCGWEIHALCCPTCDAPPAAASQSSSSKPAAMITGSGPGPIPGQFTN